MGTKSRDRLYGTSVRIAAKRAAEVRREADKLACDAWTKRMLAFKGPAQPPPKLGDALNAGYTYLEVRCLGCDTHQTVALDIVRRLRSTGTGRYLPSRAYGRRSTAAEVRSRSRSRGRIRSMAS
jgi:hypothetical protein